MTAWPNGSELERRYRRLLLAYPGRYRRRHGTEIVTTLLEMAEAGQNRPARADAWHLFASGVRQRFRLPAGRPLAVVTAILAALVMGAFGAAAGSWLGAQTFADLPADSGLAALARQATAGHGEVNQNRVTSPWWTSIASADTEVSGNWNADGAGQRFAADGWSVSAITPLDGRSIGTDPVTGAQVDLPSRDAEFTAQRDGLMLQIRGYTTADQGLVSVDGWAQSTPIFLPLIVAGIVAGLIVGWLSIAALTDRLRRAGAGRRRTVAGLSVLAALALALPAIALYGNVMRAFRYAGEQGPVFTVHNTFTPGPYYPFGPQWQILALSVAGALAAVVITVLALRRPSGQPQGVPATT